MLECKKNSVKYMSEVLKVACRILVELVQKDYSGMERLVDYAEKLLTVVKKYGYGEQQKDILRVVCLYLVNQEAADPLDRMV